MIAFLTDDPYAAYVVASYGATVVIIGGLIWASVAANARVRRELDEAEKDSRR